MTDNTASHDHGSDHAETLAELLDKVQPMGDLDQFAIDDLTPDEADEFFRILEDV